MNIIGCSSMSYRGKALACWMENHVQATKNTAQKDINVTSNIKNSLIHFSRLSNEKINNENLHKWLNLIKKKAGIKIIERH